MSKNRLASLTVLVGLVIAAAVPASAAATSGYMFPDGSLGFALASQGGVVNPGVLVGFNPQPDPPGAPATILSLIDPFNPSLTAFPPDPCVGAGACPGGSYRLTMSFLGIGDPAIGDVPAPERGITSFSFTSGSGDFTHHFLVTLSVSGPGDVADWVAFNPQPDPPGDAFGVQFGFSAPALTALAHAADSTAPEVTFSVLEDGKPLQFQVASVPEPPTWVLMLLGAGVIGLIGGYSRRSRLTIG